MNDTPENSAKPVSKPSYRQIYGTAESLAKYIEREYATWGRVVRQAKIN